MVQGTNAIYRILYPSTKIDIWNRMQYYGGENTCVKQQDEICTEGQVIYCLAHGADRADRRGIVVEPRLLNLPIHKQ